MRVYIEAYNANSKQIFGNLDGQAALATTFCGYKRTKQYRNLIAGYPARPKFSRVRFWLVVANNHKLERIDNVDFNCEEEDE